MGPRSLRRTAALGALVLGAALTLGACGGETGGGKDTAKSGNTGAASGVKLVTPGKIKTCTSLPYPPFQFDQGGKVVGFDVDLIDLAAKKLGVTQEIVDVKFDVIKSGAALNSGTCDVAAAGMTITEERKANLDFTDPYFDEVLGLLVKKGSGVKTLDEAKAKNLKIGVQTGTTSLDLAKKKGFEPVEFDDAGKQILAYQSGQVDVVLQDLPVVNDWLKKPDIAAKFELQETIVSGNQYGFAVKKGGNPELLKTINDSLKAAIADGSWAKMHKQWIGSDPQSTPAPK
ncbi:transporter substrate-binding domain-containing protein [Bailinhaonella thermotolerans]|uniref:ABC transporter substrate-binding protein n=1 Tax=Bailinhaonella thermotolerans TaxID=1070861 RepID=A0A3A4AEJ8_9ACTN|nr:transporter substrate-binding domain-containing protein [Bailinhaonella thermotolerans]RJL25164.1 ABC transporter substrate-binding protein [Bailinhaonella thermotolerans]